jgi:hypothetical protein
LPVKKNNALNNIMKKWKVNRQRVIKDPIVWRKTIKRFLCVCKDLNNNRKFIVKICKN